MVPGSDSDDILILQEGEVLAAAAPRSDNVRALADEDEALTLDQLLQKGSSSTPKGLHKKRRRRALVEVHGEAAVTKHLMFRPPAEKSLTRGKARDRARGLASAAQRTHCGPLQR